MFGKQNKKHGVQENTLANNNDKKNSSHIQERPWICLIDMDVSSAEKLKSAGFNHVVNSSFGSLTKLSGAVAGVFPHLLLNHKMPDNLHEYDIAIIDLKDREPVLYDSNEHRPSDKKQAQQSFFRCQTPQTLFDPRPYTGSIFSDEFHKKEKETITIIFATGLERIEYKLVTVSPRIAPDEDDFSLDNYSFLPLTPESTNRKGTQTKINIGFKISDILQKYNHEFRYEIIFEHPTVREGNTFVQNSNFFPLIENLSGDIVSYLQIVDSSLIFVFPQLQNKDVFLLELFQKHLPDIARNLFPFSTQFGWLKDEQYQLPNVSNLLAERHLLEQEYAEKLASKDQELEENYSKYQYLYDLLTETDTKLVKSVEQFFRWLEFDNVVNEDEAHPERRDEDLQVFLDNGLLVVEVKGIGGTSKDNECSQINKIKHRREKERNKFDVFALYIVNHQRYIPPESRSKPPFTDHQIDDAKADERGLLTTYDLFKLYFDIEAGFITKSDARSSLLDFGYVIFKPSNSVLIGTPTDLYIENTVGIFDLNGVTIRKNDEMLIYENGKYRKITAISIQDQGKDVDQASNGEMGIKFSESITKKSVVWKLGE